jgi:hypothetical protein
MCEAISLLNGVFGTCAQAVKNNNSAASKTVCMAFINVAPFFMFNL